mmetsp:Transcript_32925/g.74435  ORF Transcript_32925/g.74435 Transcript_32925/m.74435 type:complete len:344 (-) Transcript_32925:122-1153(-)
MLERSSWEAQAAISAVLSCFAYEATTYNVIFLGTILPAVGKEGLVVPFFLLFNSFWGLAMWSYLKAHTADPGTLPERWQNFVRTVGESLPVTAPRSEWQPGKATYCKKCSFPRPERAHHCHVCNVCVLRMDHHCPWLNNCVGFHNQKYFLLLLVYASISCIIALCTALPELVAVARGSEDGRIPKEMQGLQTSDVVVFLVFGVVAIFFLALVLAMLPAHIRLAFNNVTSIEGHYKNQNMPNPFDQGSIVANLEQVFGVYGLDWFLPVKPSRPLSDGICFAMSAEAKDRETLMAMDQDELWRLRYQVQQQSNGQALNQHQAGEPAPRQMSRTFGISRCGSGAYT